MISYYGIPQDLLAQVIMIVQHATEDHDDMVSLASQLIGEKLKKIYDAGTTFQLPTEEEEL